MRCDQLPGDRGGGRRGKGVFRCASLSYIEFGKYSYKVRGGGGLYGAILLAEIYVCREIGLDCRRGWEGVFY